MNDLSPPNEADSPKGAGQQDIPQHVLDYLAHTAALRYPNWADNEHSDARAYNAYQLGAVEHLLFQAAEVNAAEGYEKLRQTLLQYVACNEATQDEVFLRFRGKRSWTRAEFVQELRDNGPQALDMMVTMMASAAYLVTRDKDFPAASPTVVGGTAYAEKAAAFDQIDVIEEALRAARAERTNQTTYALEEAVQTSLPKIQRALVALAHLAGDPSLTAVGAVGPAEELVKRLEQLATPVFDEYPLPWQATTSYPPYISVPAPEEVGVHRKITEGMRKEEALFLTELVNAWPQLRSIFPFANPAALLEPLEAGGKAPLAHREAARDLSYALRELGPLDAGPADHTARNLILAAFAKIERAV